MGEGAFSFDVEESLTRFEAPFADAKSGAIYTCTFHMGEPVLYHPPHKASPVATHVTQITRDFFTCGDTTTGRMMPLRMARKVLTKLSLVDIEAATKGPDMPLGERLLWKKWLENENWRIQGKQRTQAPCCGRLVKRMYLEELSPGVISCPKCKLGDWGDASVWPEKEKNEQDETKASGESTGLEAQEKKRRKLSTETGTIVSWYNSYGFRG